MIPQKFTAKFIGKEGLSVKCSRFDFEIVDSELEFKAGQYLSVRIADGIRRSYSIFNSPLESKKNFSMLIDCSINGIGTKYIDNLKKGDVTEFLGPLGRIFLLDDQFTNTKDIHFIVTGSGIAPIHSMIKTLILVGNKSDIRLYFGTSHNSNVILYDTYKDYLEKGLIKEYTIAISKEKPIYKNAIKGRVTDLLKLKKFIPTNSSFSNSEGIIKGSAAEFTRRASFYVCGSGSMIDDTIDILKSRGISEGSIFHEKFHSSS